MRPSMSMPDNMEEKHCADKMGERHYYEDDMGCVTVRKVFIGDSYYATTAHLYENFGRVPSILLGGLVSRFTRIRRLFQP